MKTDYCGAIPILMCLNSPHTIMCKKCNFTKSILEQAIFIMLQSTALRIEDEYEYEY